MQFEPLGIVGVTTERVGQPRHDGSPGSGLYAVPVRLSRQLKADEAQLLVHLWDNPPSFSTMHRPGTARASGDTFTLERTTIEEVERYHAKTLSSIVDVFNVEVPTFRAAEEAERQRHREADEAHRQQVDDVASRIRFDRES